MSKGSQVVIAGTAYAKAPRLKKQNKRKGSRPIAPLKKARLSGSGDYNYNYKGATPFADVGRTVTKKISSYFGLPDMSQYGEMLGHGIGRIFGSGDYSTGPMVKSNILTNSTEVPKFADFGRGTVISHREYLKDVITSSVAGEFSVDPFVINPGNAKTFPWLSTICQNYEQYKIHGMVFYFKSTSGESVSSTNTAIGTVIMATDYDISDSDFDTKHRMENNEFSQSGKASINMIHGIECARGDRATELFYVRQSNVASLDRESDFAKFQIATQGFQATNVNVGELWVSYVIEFLKPQLPRTVSGNVFSANYISAANTVVGAPTILGTGGTFTSHGFALSVSGTVLTISGVHTGMSILCYFFWAGGVASYTRPTFTPVGCGLIGSLFPGFNSISSPTNGISSGQVSVTQQIRVERDNTCTLSLGSASLPTNATCYLFVTKVDSAYILN